MKALVTGGAGFIGSNLVGTLAKRGDEVTVLDNLSSGYEANLAPFPNVRFVKGDIRDADCLARVVRGADTIFHLAASVGNKRSIDRPLVDAEINLLGTITVLEAARQCDVRKVIVSSSAAVFGELRSLPIREDHPVEPDSPYGASKLAAEKVSLAFSRLYALDVLCLRYFNVYGPNQRYDAYGNVIPIFSSLMLRGERVTVFGDGEQTRDFVSVHDVVQANLRAALTPAGVSGALNIGSATQTSINGLVALLSEVSGLTPVVEHTAPRPGDVRDSLADISAARNLIGFEPQVQLRRGLSEYVNWARKEIRCERA